MAPSVRNLKTVSPVNKLLLRCKVVCVKIDDHKEQVVNNEKYVNKRQTRSLSRISESLKMEVRTKNKCPKFISLSEDKIRVILNTIKTYVDFEKSYNRYIALEKVTKGRQCCNSNTSTSPETSLKCKVNLDKIDISALLTKPKFTSSDSLSSIKAEYETSSGEVRSLDLNTSITDPQNGYNVSYLAEATYTTKKRSKGAKKYYPFFSYVNNETVFSGPLSINQTSDHSKDNKSEALVNNFRRSENEDMAGNIENLHIFRGLCTDKKELSSSNNCGKEKRNKAKCYIQEEMIQLSNELNIEKAKSANVKQAKSNKKQTASLDSIKPEIKKVEFTKKMNLKKNKSTETEELNNSLNKCSENHFLNICDARVFDKNNITLYQKYLNTNNLTNNNKNIFSRNEKLNDEDSCDNVRDIKNNTANVSCEIWTDDITLINEQTEVLPSPRDIPTSLSDDLMPLTNCEFNCISDPQSASSPMWNSNNNMDFQINTNLGLKECSQYSDFNTSVVSNHKNDLKNNLYENSNCNYPREITNTQEFGLFKNNVSKITEHYINSFLLDCEESQNKTETIFKSTENIILSQKKVKNDAVIFLFNEKNDSFINTNKFDIQNESNMLDVVRTKDNIAENFSNAERVNETRCEINPNIYNLDMANSTSCETHHTPCIETPSSTSIIHANNNEDSTSNGGSTDEIKKKENNVKRKIRRIKLDRSFASDSKCISRKRRWKTSCNSLSLENKTERDENIQPLNENRTVDIVKQQNQSENYLEQYHSEINLSNEESKNENSENNNELVQHKECALQENSQIENENLNISDFNKLPNKRRKEDENESIVYRLKSFTPVISTKKEVKFHIFSSLLRNEAEPLPFHTFETYKNKEPTMPIFKTFLSNLPEQNMTPSDYPTNKKDLVENWLNKAESDFDDFKVPLLLDKNLKFKTKAQTDSNPRHLISLPIATDNVARKTKVTKVNDDDCDSSSSSDDIISLYASSLHSLYEDKIDQQVQSSKKLSTPADIDQKRHKITFENSQGPSKYPKDEWKQSHSCEFFLDNMEVKKARRKLTLLPLAESEATLNNTVKHILFPYPCCYSYVLDCCSRAVCGFVHNLPDLHLVKQNMSKCTPLEVTGCYNLVRKTFKAFHFYFSVFFDLYDASDNENMLLHMALDAIKFFQNRSYLDILVFRFRRHYTLHEILDFFNKNCVIQNCRVFEYFLLSLKEESLLISNVLLLKAFNKNSYFKSSSTVEILTNECFQTKDTEFINEVNEILSEMDAKLLLSNASHVKNFVKLVQTTKCISPYKILFKLCFIEDETKSTDFDEQNKSYNTKTYNSGAVRAGTYKSPNLIINNYKFKNLKYHNGRYSRPYYHNTWHDKTNCRENRIESSETLNIEHDNIHATSNCNINLLNNDSAKIPDEQLFLRRHQIKDLNNFKKLNLQRNVITNNAESQHASSTLQANLKPPHEETSGAHVYQYDAHSEKRSHSHWQHKWKSNKLFSDEALNIKRSQEYRPLPQNIEADSNCREALSKVPEKDPLDIEQISAKFSDSDFSEITASSNNSEAKLDSD